MRPEIPEVLGKSSDQFPLLEKFQKKPNSPDVMEKSWNSENRTC